MDEKEIKERLELFDSRPIGEPVNPYVIRIAPQSHPDYATIQQTISESAQLTKSDK